MIFEATGSNDFGELSVDSLKLHGDNEFLADLFNILSNQTGRDITHGGSRYRPEHQLRDAISRIKSGVYSMVPDPPVQSSGGIQVVPVTKEAVSTDTHICPRCQNKDPKDTGVICRMCHRGEVETRMAQSPNIDRTYTHTCHNCQCSISGVRPTERACPECGAVMVCTKDAKL